MSLNDLRTTREALLELKTDESVKLASAAGVGGANLNIHKNSKLKRFSSQDITLDDHFYMKLNKPELIRNSAIYRTISDEFCENLQGMRRGSSFIKMLSTESEEGRYYGGIGRLDTRGSSLEDDVSRRSSKSDTRRESSFGRISEERDYECDLVADKQNLLKPANVNTSKAEEAATKLGGEKDGSDEQQADGAPIFNVTPSYYINLIENINNIDCANVLTSLNEQGGGGGGGSGEWDTFWRQYNCPSGDCMSHPYVCPSNSLEEETSRASDSGSAPGDAHHAFLTADELADALDCTERLHELLRRASRRAAAAAAAAADLDDAKAGFFSRKNSSKERTHATHDDGDKHRNLLKSANSNCITLLLNNSGVGDILKRVLSRRRDFILSSESRKSQ